MEKLKSLFVKFKAYIGLLIGFVGLCIFFALMEPAFLSTNNIMNVLRQIAVNAILAFGMTFVLLTASIDLSIGSTVSLAGMFCATLIGLYGWPVYPTVLLALVIGALIGLLNGFIVGKTELWPFIVTLASSLVIRGIAYSISKGSPVRVLNDAFNKIGTAMIGPVGIPIIYMAVLLLCCYVVLQRTRFGRHIYAVGGNPEAARFAGINIMKVKIIAYMVSGVFAAFVGIFLTARMYTGQPTIGDTLANDAIAATVVGGTSMAGGKGRIVGTMIGAMLIGVISNGMNLLDLSSYLQDIAKGIIILGAVWIDKVSTQKLQKAG